MQCRYFDLPRSYTCIKYIQRPEYEYKCDTVHTYTTIYTCNILSDTYKHARKYI